MCCLASLGAAFDIIDHTILLNRLEQYVGIRETALNWFASYLEGRTFSLEIDNIISFSAACTCVPQGSVLGPLCFLWLIFFVNIRLCIIVMQMTHSFIYLLSLTV